MNESRKHVASVLLAVFMLLSVGLSSGVELTLSVPPELPEGGGSFSVSVSVDSVTDLAGYQIQVQFLQDFTPSSGFTLTATSEGEVFGSQSTYGNLVDGRYSMLNAGAASGSGLLCTLLFEYDSTLAGEFIVDAHFVKLGAADETVMEYTVNAPVFIIGEGGERAAGSWLEAYILELTEGQGQTPLDGSSVFLPYEGDANQDMSVDIMDLIYVRNRLNLPAELHCMANQNEDANINILDLIYVRNRLGMQILRHLRKIRATAPLVDRSAEGTDPVFPGYMRVAFEPLSEANVPMIIDLDGFVMCGVSLAGSIEWSFTTLPPQAADMLAIDDLNHRLVFTGDYPDTWDWAIVYLSGRLMGDDVDPLRIDIEIVRGATLSLPDPNMYTGKDSIVGHILFPQQAIGLDLVIRTCTQCCSTVQEGGEGLGLLEEENPCEEKVDLFIKRYDDTDWTPIEPGSAFTTTTNSYDLKITAVEKCTGWDCWLDAELDKQKSKENAGGCKRIGHSVIDLSLVCEEACTAGVAQGGMGLLDAYGVCTIPSVVRVNLDDDDGDLKIDREDINVEGGDDELVYFSVALDNHFIKSNCQIGGGTVTLSSNNVQVGFFSTADKTVESPCSWVIPEGTQIWTVSQWLEGKDVSEGTCLATFIAQGCALLDDDPVSVIFDVDLDIDSENNNGLSQPDRSLEEEVVEDWLNDPERPGKIIQVSDGDIDDCLDENGNEVTEGDADGVPDGDGIQDFADPLVQGGKFVPIVLSFMVPPMGESWDPSKLRIAVDYDSSDPRPAFNTGVLPDVGKLRIWKKNANEERDPKPANGDPAGDFLCGRDDPDTEDNKENVYTAAQLGLTLEERVYTGFFYVEAVKPSSQAGGDAISFGVYMEDGEDPREIGSDSVNVTLVELELHPKDSDFAEGKEGRILISTKNDNQYDTTVPTTKLDQPAQTEDRKLRVTAHLRPAIAYHNLNVCFEAIDPDDPSACDADPAPNDNWDAQIGAGTLSASSDAASLYTINGASVAAAETILTITNRYSGDNYKVIVSLYNDERGLCQLSSLFTAWKRIHVEVDKMFMAGADCSAPNGDGIGAQGDTVYLVSYMYEHPESQVIVFPKLNDMAKVIDSSDDEHNTGEDAQIIAIEEMQGYIKVTLDRALQRTYRTAFDAHLGRLQFPTYFDPPDFAAIEVAMNDVYVEARSAEEGSSIVPYVYRVSDAGSYHTDLKDFSQKWFKNRAYREDDDEFNPGRALFDTGKENFFHVFSCNQIAPRCLPGTSYYSANVCAVTDCWEIPRRFTSPHEIAHLFQTQKGYEGDGHCTELVCGSQNPCLMHRDHITECLRFCTYHSFGEKIGIRTAEDSPGR